MYIYTCEHNWEAMLTCIYEAWSSKRGQQNIRLQLEPVGQYGLFDEYIHVDANQEKATKVIDAINIKISQYVYRELAITAMAYEEDVLDNIFRVLILGFAFGPGVLDMVQYKDIMRNQEIRGRVTREANRFQEITRFHQIGHMYVAHIEPKSQIVEYLGPIFQDRMPSENFMIVDDIHREAVVHPKNENYYMWTLDEKEFQSILKTEQENDEYTDLWKAFFDSIAIKERTNPKCQMTHFPIWARKHAVEFF